MAKKPRKIKYDITPSELPGWLKYPPKKGHWILEPHPSIRGWWQLTTNTAFYG